MYSQPFFILDILGASPHEQPARAVNGLGLVITALQVYL